MLLILETVVELNDIRMMQCLLKSYLICQSNTSSVGPKLIFEDDLRGCSGFGFNAFGDEAVRKPSFSEQSTFQVLFDDVCPINSANMLQNDRGAVVNVTLIILFLLNRSRSIVAGFGFAETHMISVTRVRFSIDFKL